MKGFSIIAGIMILVLSVSVLVGVSDVVSVQGQRGDHHGKGFWTNLTEEQREAVQEKTKEMRSQDATREEIRAAKAEMFQEFGIELPEDWGEGPRRNRGHGGPDFDRRFWVDLTDEQREMIRDKIREMRGQGAPREEIRGAVAELLEEFGIELPQKPESTSSKTPSTEGHIVAHNSPNPFNPETYINYTLDVSGSVRIQIYNVTGQAIWSFTVGDQQAGIYSVRWDGCDRNGVPASSGIYFYRIEAGPYAIMNRMMLLK